MKNKIAIFASGNGSNFEALAKGCLDGQIDAEVALCVCDRPGAYVTERARRLGIPVLEFSPRDYGSKAEFEAMLVDRLRSEGVTLVCLAGYMRIIGPVLLEAFADRIVNIHPSLLPAFKGAHAIRDAFDYGVKVFGVTVHWVDASLDGGKIIAQSAVPYEGTDIEVLENMIHAHEHALYVSAVGRLINKQ